MPDSALPPDLLVRPAAESVRVIARGYLDAAGAAMQRLDDPKDLEALHDVRVAIRRLRTTVRAYRPELRGSVRPKLRRRLRDIAEQTNRVREAEVALDWLRPLQPDLTPRERIGLRWLAHRLEDRRAQGLEHARTDVRRLFHVVERKLRTGLGVYRQEMDAARSRPAEPFAAVAGRVLRAQAEELDRLLRIVRAPDDAETHLARVAAKRLRYLLEPLTHSLPAAAAVVLRLKELQDRLGELHDTIELMHEVRAAAETAAAERAAAMVEAALTDQVGPEQLRATRRTADPRSGLIAVARRLRARLTALFARLQTTTRAHDRAWLGEVEAALAGPGPGAHARIPVPAPPREQRARQRRARRQRSI